jgi:hypothetical protein
MAEKQVYLEIVLPYCGHYKRKCALIALELYQYIHVVIKYKN